MLIIGNGRMITRDASKAFIENGAVAMDGNTIVMVGTTDEVKKAYPDGEFVDARGGVIMPAFINTHEHIYSSFARGLSIKGYNPKGFLDILDGQWWTIDRHLTFFNTEGIWGALIHGIVLAMEEQRAMGLPVADEAIQGIKVGLMGPLAGIGDTIDWSTIKPLMAMLCLPLAESGSFIAPVIYFILVAGILTTEEFFFVNIGYRMGTEAAMTILGGGMVNKFISCASVLGMFMMGGLSASMVNVYTTAQIPTGEGTVMAIQGDILDAVAPGLLTLATVLLVYKYLRSGHSMMKATFWLLVIGLVLGAVGIIGDGGFLIKPIMDLTAAA